MDRDESPVSERRDEAAPGRGGLAASMRAAVAEAVRAGGLARRLTPAALVSFLAAAALTPLLVPLVGGMGGGEAGAALGQLGGIGGGYLAAVLTGIADRARRPERERSGQATSEHLRAELATVIEQALADPGEAGIGLRGEVSAVLRDSGAIQAALAADQGGELAPRLAELGEQMAGFGWVLDDLGTRLAEVQRTLIQQGVSQRSQILAVRDELDVITGLVQRVAAAQAVRAAGPRAEEAGPGDLCPYPGLRPFGSSDARWFFGRQELVAHLVGRLGEQMAAGLPLFLLGPSGAGKSSLLRAGLVPALRAGLLPVAGSRRWPRVLIDRPGGQPLTTLAKAVASRAGSTDGALRTALDGDPDAAADALARSLPGDRAGRLVLVVDQFEDIFTQCGDETERARFAGVLLALARQGGTAPGTAVAGRPAGALVVVSVRSDFYADCAAIGELRRLLPDSQLMVGPLSEAELRAAITRPAAAAGCDVEPGLTELLLTDLGVRPGSGASHEPGALPLLGYALQATWERREARTLTVAGYRAAGGIHGAIATEADRIYQDFPATAQPVVRRIMLRLVSGGAQVTRRRVSRADLLAGLDPAAAGAVLARFTQARLISAGTEGVEITHEAFLGAWPRLREWIAEDQAGLLRHRQIADDARIWAEVGRDPGSLYRGIRLGEARDWRTAGDNEAELTALERQFLDASTAAEEAGQAAELRQRQRDRQQNRRLRALAGGLAVVLVAALVAAGLAVSSGRAAQAQLRRAQSGAFAAQSDQAASVNLADADLLALAAWQEDHTPAALSSLLSREADPYAGSFAMPPGYLTVSDAVSPDGRLLAVGGQPGLQDYRRSSVWLWDLAAHRRLATFTGLNGVVGHVAFSPAGTTLAADVSGHPGSLRLWSVATGRPLPNPTGDTGPLSALAYSPDGRLLAVAQGPTRLIDVWDLARHRLIARLAGNRGLVWSLAFSPDGRLLASGGADGTVRLWTVATGRQRAVFRRAAGPVRSVEFAPGGTVLAAASMDGTVWVWDPATGSSVLEDDFGATDTPSIAFGQEGQYLYVLDPARGELVTHGLTVGTETTMQIGPHPSPFELAASPRGAVLVLGGPGGGLIALDEGRGTFYQPADNSLFQVAVSPAGHLVATSAGDGTVQLWDPADPQVPARLLPTGQLSTGAVAFSPGGQVLATDGPGDSVVLWNVATGTRRAVLTAPAGPVSSSDAVESIAFSPEGKTLATATLFGTVAEWDLATGRRLALIQAGSPSATTAAFGLAYSPDGRTLAFVTGSGAVGLWDVRSNRVTRHLPVRGGAEAIAFSPDGRLLAAGGADAVTLWAAATLRRAGSLGPLTSTVRSLAFSPDSATLAVATEDTSVQLWQVARRQLATTLAGHTQQVNDVAYTPDGRDLITTSADGTARIWDLNPADEVRRLCSVLRGTMASQWRLLNPSPGPDPCPGS
ncbi:MAG TPA: hypothetical protein VIX86_02740 [Streptosporangiaceae bacterium]